MSQDLEFEQIDQLQQRINNIVFILGQDLIKAKTQSVVNKNNQSQTTSVQIQLSTIDAYKLLQKKLQDKKIDQHQDFVTQLIHTQKIIEEQQAVQQLCLTINEKANILLQESQKIKQNMDSLKQIEQMKRYLEFAPVFDQKAKIQELLPLDQEFLIHAKQNQKNSQMLDQFLKVNNQIINDINLRFINVEKKLSSLEKLQ